MSETLKTSLYNLHKELGGKMVPFAGYEMPVQYTAGIVAEHKQCREKAALFDVSHMGQVTIKGENPAKALETLVPGVYLKLKEGRQRYTIFTNDNGGILDDLMVSNMGDHLFVVVNAACKNEDIAYMKEKLVGYEVTEITNRSLIAIQGPEAKTAMARIAPESVSMVFMDFRSIKVGGIDCFVARAGYTGEDGFEISVPEEHAEKIAKLLLEQPEVAPAGLGARDTLRLEAGLCLYGNDIDTTTTPIEASLEWVIGKRRKEEGGFPGANVILKQLKEGVTRKRVGIIPTGKAPARAHTKILNMNGQEIGEITSGGFGPTIGCPIAMGYVPTDMAAVGTELKLLVRGKEIPAKVAATPFVEQRYYRG